MRVYLVLLEGRSGADPLFLQVKQAGPSVYEVHTHPSRHDHHGARVINGKRLVQSATDIFVGCGSTPILERAGPSMPLWASLFGVTPSRTSEITRSW
jgi:hypothetical protein